MPRLPSRGWGGGDASPLLTGARLCQLALEALDASAGVDELLLARVERMTVGADLHVDVALGGTGRELVPAGATHVGDRVFGMDFGLHGSSYCRRVYQPSPLHFAELGEGVPIILLHPGPGLDGSVFLPGVERLAAAGHRVILADPPGNGRSPAGEWTLASYAAAVQGLAESLELRDWALYGHSFGGHVAAQHLVSFPDAAARLILACTDVDEEGPVEFDPFFGLPDDVAARIRVAFAKEK